MSPNLQRIYLTKGYFGSSEIRSLQCLSQATADSINTWSVLLLPHYSRRRLMRQRKDLNLKVYTTRGQSQMRRFRTIKGPQKRGWPAPTWLNSLIYDTWECIASHIKVTLGEYYVITATLRWRGNLCRKFITVFQGIFRMAIISVIAGAFFKIFTYTYCIFTWWSTQMNRTCSRTSEPSSSVII